MAPNDFPFTVSSTSYEPCIQQVMSKIDLKFHNISYKVKGFTKKDSKILIENINGNFATGELIAIMGPSGAGKSTLLNILAGYKKKINSGEILVNGESRNLRKFRKQSCYIMQESILLEQMTVFETMTMASNLKLGYSVKKENKLCIIDEILESLGLTDCKNTKNSKLSGGQRKRLCIAQELVSNPPIMFLDEPTSGLDSSSSYNCIQLLKTLARQGRMVVCSIHQPSAKILEMFDKIYLLAEGKCIFSGEVIELVPFLAKQGYNCPPYHNPADYALEVACGEHGEAISKLALAVKKRNNAIYKISVPISIHSCSEIVLCKELTKTQQIQNIPNSFFIETWLLLKRSLLCISKDMLQTHFKIGANILIGIVLGLVYFQIGNDASSVVFNNAFIMACSLFLMFCAMMPTIVTFPLDNAVFTREYLNSWYRLPTYFLAKSVADMPVQIICSVLFLTLAYFISGQPAELFRFSIFLLIGILTAINAQSVGLFVGIIVPIQNGVVLGPSITLPMTIFSGFFLPYNDIPIYLRWLSYLSYIRYSWEGFIVILYQYDRPNLDCDQEYCHYKNPNVFLKQIGIEQDNVWICIGALFLLSCVKRFLAYLVLRHRVKKE